MRHRSIPLTLLAWAVMAAVDPLLRAGGLDDLLPAGAEVKKVAGGFGFTEGPAWGPQGFLVFSDIPNNRVMKLAPGGTAEVFLEGSEGANGLIFDPSGRLYVCQGSGRRVARVEVAGGKPGRKTVLADAYEGKKLNSPNDLALDAQGGLYFTDPRYGGSEPVEQPVMGVYYLGIDGKLARVIADLKRPNGILASPDGKRLYVANPDARELYRYEIEGPGKLSGKKLIFTGDQQLDGGGPDGMALDERGNVYATYKGIVVLDPDGRLLGRIAVPEHPANCTFGGPDRRTLYITARTSLYAIDTKVQGMELLGPRSGTAATREVKLGSLALRVPPGWKDRGGDSAMRVGQFEVPAAPGAAGPAELVVYYFGPRGAGGVTANLKRWLDQFTAEGRKARFTKGKGQAGEYTLADVSGTFNQPIGPPIERRTKAMPNARMLAAIIPAAEGPYFLKLTGPETSVTPAATDFRASFGGDAGSEAEFELEGK